MIGVIIALAVVGLAAMIALTYRQTGAINKIEEIQLKQIASETDSRKSIDQRIEHIITIHNSTVEHYDSEIDQICKAMDKICEDIHRIDHEQKDLRRYYINYRTPVQSNGGVDWAGKIRSSEDL